MARYTLKTYCGVKLLEVFEHRTVSKLYNILTHPRMHKEGETDAFGNLLTYSDKFEIYDSMREKLFAGKIDDTLNFIKGLK